MPTFGEVQGHKDELWRKALGAIVAVTPYSTAAITNILDPTTGTLAALPAAWTQLGRPTEDGITWPRETEVSELFGMGSVNPARSDIRRVTKRVSFTLAEVRKAGMELAQGITITPTVTKVPATTGNQHLTYDEPELPTYPYMRLIAIARDVTAGGEMYIARQLLRCRVTEVGEETWSDQDQAMVQQLTLTAYHDSVAGTAMRHFRGGPGYGQVIVNEGFTAAA